MPPTASSKARKDDEDEEDEDPTEMFHRDVGTQTVFDIPSKTEAPQEAPSESQASRLEKLTRSLTEIKDGLRSQSDDLGDVKTVIDVFRDDLDTVTYRSPEIIGYDYSRSKKTNEPEDEMRKVRDSIRRVKGVLLSTRSFPASTR